MSEVFQPLVCGIPHMHSAVVKLGHGSGGRMTHNLIEEIFLPAFGNDVLSELDDAALLNIANPNIAFTTDSYVVSPIFFPGGNIGSLSIHGTINDLAMRGAKPLFIAASFILEEGLPLQDLAKIIASMKDACAAAGVKIVTGDTKVVNRGAADKIFITTTGIGVVEKLPAPAANRAVAGDLIIISGDIGRHGAAIMCSRDGIELETSIMSDSCSMHNIVASAMQGTAEIHCLRDITRGGLATVLNEIAASSRVGIDLDDAAIPVHPEVKAISEILGLDPLHMACEGRLVAVLPPSSSELVLSRLKEQPDASGSVVIGRIVEEHVGRVILKSKVGGSRIVDLLSGEQLPRIC